MQLRLLGLILWLLIAGCAQLPQVELKLVRAEVAKAYAGGAKVLAPADYEAALMALHDAELQVARGNYRPARKSLNLALLHATKALDLAQVKIVEIEEQRKARELRARREMERMARDAGARKKKKADRHKSPKPEPDPVPKPEIVLLDQVEVVEGDTLYSLAARKDVYADGLLWPLIYKANRDQIKDPLQIFVGQLFTVPRDKNLQERAAAREEALDSGLFRGL